MPDSLGRDTKGENTRNKRGLCHMKACARRPATYEVTYFDKKRLMCKYHAERLDGVK